jgi:signal transduction histidine kinase
MEKPSTVPSEDLGMDRKRLWNERTRMLVTLELAVVLPAAALIGFSIWKLKSIRRDKVVEAAIQRDLSHMLKIAEKRIDERIYKQVSDIRSEFPDPDDCAAATLDKILQKHPEIAHVFIYDSKAGLIFRSQPRRAGEADFQSESAQGQEMVSGWIKSEAPELVRKLHEWEEKEHAPQYAFFYNWVPRGSKKAYQTAALLTLPKLAPGRVALGGVAFDSEYLRNEFFPNALNTLCAQDISAPHGAPGSSNEVVMMVHPKKETEPLATSKGWDRGDPEVERNFDDVFPGLTLAIKFSGTTVEALSHRFMMTSFLIIGGLSLFLAGGILLTYRNVAREMALARLKSEFVANVSHELRTPLSLIRLYAETLELGRLSSPEKCKEYFHIIRKESERLTGLINNILDFSRIEAGRKEYSFRETDLAELVRKTLESYRYQIEQQGFVFEQNIANNVPPLRVDREAMARSLLNLVNNALKYSQQEKFLGVNLYRTDGLVKLEVIDRGIGIPRGEQGKIFEKFYRVGTPLVHTTKGSGLGLSLVRHIVEAHGGAIAVESAPGRGSKFVITLPLGSGSAGTTPS